MTSRISIMQQARSDSQFVAIVGRRSDRI